MAKAPSMCCPHCKSTASVRTSNRITPVYKEVTYMCRNPLCGHTFVAALEAVRTLSPSAIPDPEVNLPLSPHVRRTVLAAQLELVLIAAPG